MHRYATLFLTVSMLIFALCLGGCGRQSDTNDPEPATPERAAPDDVVPVEPGSTGPESIPGTSDPQDAPEAAIITEEETGDSASPTDDGSADESTVIICTPEWFAWVNEQVIALPDGKLAELYPTGLPETGSAEWFMAVDKLTGGDGAHGPDGGSAEWCSMIQQRLERSSAPTP